MDGSLDVNGLRHKLGALEERLWDSRIWKCVDVRVFDSGIGEDWANLRPVLHESAVLLTIHNERLRSGDVVDRFAEENHNAIGECVHIR